LRLRPHRPRKRRRRAVEGLGTEVAPFAGRSNAGDTSNEEDDMAATSQGSILSDAMLARCAERAPDYDRDNRFFAEDFAELKQAGYLACAVPRELGGGGLTFAQVMAEQRRSPR
jgi:alkylation response protein AidB-like acyl-CoA dehydrogenase